tara:strand:- start:2014 stop:2523 length:510 start_codon:yes stop_codon:yes gene_type:complete
MRNFIIFAFLVLISQSKAYACSILNVDIGTSVSAASEKFDFLETFDPAAYGDIYSVRFTMPAKDYCEDSNLENADLEVIVYNSQIAGINVLSWDPNIKNEIYDFANNFIGSVGEDLKKDTAGIKDLSLGNLIIVYSKYEHQEQIHELLEITNGQFSNYVIGEEILDANG